jgi:hypothetical protein
MWPTWLLLSACSAPDADAIVADRSDQPPDGLAEPVWEDALTAWSCAVDGRHTRSAVLGIADFSRPSDAPRLWVVDLESGEVLVHDRVAHGSGSGGRFATEFSSEPGSHATSLGLYRGVRPYHGKHGRSLLLDGLEPANATARARAVVVHPSTYVDDGWVAKHGRVGRSWGCFAVDPDLADRVVDALHGGTLLAWAPDEDWRTTSPFLTCRQTARSARGPRGVRGGR